MLDHDHANRRQLRDLVAPEPPPRLALIVSELAAAPTTSIRIVIDDLIDLILRRQLPPRAAMPRLATSLTLSTQQLLSLRPGLRPTLLTSLRQIRRRRLGAVTRVLPRLLLQPPQPLLKPLDLLGQS